MSFTTLGRRKCQHRSESGHTRRGLGDDMIEDTGGAEAERQEDDSKLQKRLGRNWKIAWCHAGDSGGSKRAAFEMVRELSKRGHRIDEYIVRLGEPDLEHWPLRPYVQHSHYTIFEQPVRGGLRPYLLDAWLTLAKNMFKMRQIRRSLGQLAGEMNRRAYDFVHIDQCPPSLTVALLPHLRLPTVVYSHEASNLRYQSVQHSRLHKHGSLPRRMYVWLCELAERLLSDLRNSRDIESTKRATLILTNSYYSKEAIFQRLFCMASVCRCGVDVETFRPLSLPSERMVLSVGRVVPAKQHHLVIAAVSLIPASRRPRVIVATPEHISSLDTV